MYHRIDWTSEKIRVRSTVIGPLACHRQRALLPILLCIFSQRIFTQGVVFTGIKG